MSIMTYKLRIATVIFAAAGTIGSAQAQSYGAPYGRQPLYPYDAQQPYAVEVAPNTYVIQRPPARNYPYITCVNCSRNSANAVTPEPSASRFDRPHRPNDPALIDELRKRNGMTETVINTKRIVREKPIVRETTRVVEDPPRVIERRHIVDDLPPPAPLRRRAKASVEVGDEGQAKSAEASVRVIHAEAEVTILGPDRMSIRLFRKRGEPEAKAQPGE
jgi:hypothetical protein